MNECELIRLEEIKGAIKKQEGKRTIGIVLVIISIFCLWPLMIVGAALWGSANKKIDKLLEEERAIQIKMIMMKERSGNYEAEG